LANREKLLAKRKLRYTVNREKYSLQRADYRKKNREAIKRRQRQWYLQNHEEQSAKARMYRLEHRDKINARKRASHKADPTRKRKSDSAYYRANRDTLIQRVKAWRAANRTLAAEYRRRYTHRRRAANRLALLPVTSSAIDQRFSMWSNRCAFCGVTATHPRNAGHAKLTEDHALALSKQGLDEAANIIPACHSCNCSKNAKPIETWYRSQPFFTEARWRKIQRHCPAAVVGQLSIGA
jgi:hypothetical protein